LLTKVHQN